MSIILGLSYWWRRIPIPPPREERGAPSSLLKEVHPTNGAWAWRLCSWDRKIHYLARCSITIFCVGPCKRSTTCCAAGPYLAIAGRGMRPQPQLRTTTPQQSKRRRFSTSKRGASTRIGVPTFKDNNWWEEEQEETTPQETKPLDQTKSSEGTTTAATTNASSQEPVLASTPGGFVTFVSLRHYSETRTVYLTLVPTHMSYMIWQNMEFVVILDNEHSSQAVAIRIDASSYNDPFADVEEEAFVDGNPIHNKDRYFIRRFQVLPIDIPQGELSPRLLCGSSPHVSPPALSLAYLDPTSTSVLPVQRTLYRIVPLLARGASSSRPVWVFPPSIIQPMWRE